MKRACPIRAPALDSRGLANRLPGGRYPFQSRERLPSIASFIPLTAYDFSLLDNLRRIRNDIQYYGTKSENDINDFYEHNKNAIPLAIEELRREAAKRIGK